MFLHYFIVGVIMKKAYLIITLLLLGVMLGHVRAWSYSDDLMFHVNVLNLGSKSVDNLRVTVYIPELGIFKRTSQFDLSKGDNTARILIEPTMASHGYYLTRISLSSSEKGTEDTKYIYTFI